MVLAIVLFAVGAFVGGYFELKVKTKGGLNLTYTDSTGAVKNVF